MKKHRSKKKWLANFFPFLIKSFWGPKVSNCLNLWTQKVQLFDFGGSQKTTLQTSQNLKMKKHRSKKKMVGQLFFLFKSNLFWVQKCPIV
jgi:hypothetical protein